jgi:hypothetical protein
MRRRDQPREHAHSVRCLPVGVPPDPPALLLPKPVLGWNPDVVAGPVNPPPRLRRWAKPPKWACCAKAVLVAPAINNVTSNRKCLLRMTLPFRFEFQTLLS